MKAPNPDHGAGASAASAGRARSADSSPIANPGPAAWAARLPPQAPRVAGGNERLARPAGRPDGGWIAKQGASTVEFSAAEERLLNRANRVLLMEYSSTGGGHTARSLDPVILAASGDIQHPTLKPGDCVVVMAPPRWESDKDGGKVNTLHDKAAALRKLGLHVIIKQADKSVTGLYQRNGDSDNVRMLKDFVYKPQRDPANTPLSTERIRAGGARDAPFATGAGASAKQLLDAVVSAIGKGGLNKVAVLGDMAPFLQKAAASLSDEINDNKIKGSVEIGNHQGLFTGDARLQLGKKDLAYLHKASGSGHAQKLALVEYSPDVNVVRDLASTLRKLGISGKTGKLEAREKVLSHLLAEGVRLDLAPGVNARPGILLGEGAKRPEDVKAMVYLYVNEYTQGAVDHIRQQMKDQPATYGRSLFAVCGNGAFRHDMDKGKASNILQVMYAANADGVTNAGFGTTSEFFYMAHKPQDYAGKFVAFPVVNQHEQQANAAQLSAAMPGHVTNATGSAQTMYEAIDQLVAQRSLHPRAHLAGNMERLLAGSMRETSGAQHAAGLLAALYAADGRHGLAESERPSATAAKLRMAQYDAEHSAKQCRRIYKLYVPALDAIAQGQGSCKVRATTKVAAQEKSVAEIAGLLQGMADPAKRHEAQQLMDIDFNNEHAQKLAVDLGNRLNSILAMEVIRQLSISSDQEPHAAAQAAKRELKDLAENRVALGW